MRKPYLWLLLAILVFIFLVIAVLPPSRSSGPGKIPPSYQLGAFNRQNIASITAPGCCYVISVDRLTLHDLMEHADLFTELTGKAALGLMSSSVNGSMTPDSTYATIGAGAPVNAHGTADAGMNAWETMQGVPAAEIYRQRTGRESPPGAVLQLEIARINKLNLNNPYSAVPGYLCSLLKKQGVPVQILGNADYLNTPYRPAVGLAMNKEGIVQSGDVGQQTLVQDVDFPGRYRTNYNMLLDAAFSRKQGPGFTVIELGDLERLARAGSALEDEVLQARRRQTIAAIAAFIEKAVQRIDLQHNLLIIVSPTPRGDYVTGYNYLTPVIVVGGNTKPGLLTSPTTRRPGIVKNTDLAPTVLHYFGIDVPAQMSGRVMQFIPANNVLPKLASLYANLELTYRARPPILRNYVLMQIILVGMSLAAIFLPRRDNLMKTLKPLLLAVISVPLALLLIAPLPHPSITALVGELITVTAIITVVLHLWLKSYEHELDPFILVSLLTSLFIVVDLLFGAPMQKCSLLGYDPIVGARFYGIGNEYMGVLLGSTIMGTTTLVSRLAGKKRLILPVVGLYYLVTLYVMAAPQLGTNVGGSLAGLASFLVTFLLLAGVRFNARTLLKIVAAIGLFIMALAVYDLQRPVASQSHIGRTAALILQNGPGEIINIASRKINMNIKLIRYTIWSRIFLISLGTLAILFYRPTGVIHTISSRYPDVYKGFIGIVTASITALFCNDSGIVAAATTMIFGAPPLLYLAIRHLRIKHGEEYNGI